MPLSTCQFLIFAAFASAIAFGGCDQQPNQPQEGTNSAVLHYPETRRVDQTDDYHGVKVADPYRWLEGDVRESPEVAEWVAKQNEIARAYLDAIPQRPQIARRLTEIWNYERFSPPQQQGGKYFYLQERRPAEPGGAICGRHVRCRGPRADRSEHVVEGRHVALADTMRRATMASYWRTRRPEAGSDWQQIYRHRRRNRRSSSRTI